MSILTGPEIERVVTVTKAAARINAEHGWPGATFTPRIDVTPWRPECVGPNSLDVHLGETLLRYDTRVGHYIDPEFPPPAVPFEAFTGPSPGRGPRWYLKPGTLYLGATAERIECHGVVPWIDGRSSLGRLGVSVHVTAGRGDDGWPGPGREPAPFTLEITVVHPTILRPGMRLAQVTFLRVEGERRPYAGRYAGATGPEASKFHQDGPGR